MSNVKQLKDASGNSFSPKTSIDALTSTGGGGKFLVTNDLGGVEGTLSVTNVPQISGTTEAGHFASFDSNGGIQDSHYKADDFAPIAQAVPAPQSSDEGKILGYEAPTEGANPIVGWVQKPQDGASAYDLYEQAEIAAGRTPLSPEAWLASLKANIGEFLFVPTDQAAVMAMGTIGQTYSSAIDPNGKNVAPTQNTLSVILLMNDDATTPTKTMMIATQDDGNNGYEFVYIGDLQNAIPNDIFSDYAKNALLALLRKVAYIDGNGETYIGTLESALFPDKELLGITAIYTQSGAIYTTDSLDDLKVDLVVTASYSDGTSETISDYVLSGTLSEGTSVITVEYRGEEATFNVTVSVGLLGHWLIGKGFEQYPTEENVEKYVYVAGAASTSRAIYIETSGTNPFKYRSGSQAGQSSDLYPVILPTGATSIEATSTNANVLLSIFALEYTEDKWHRVGYIVYTTNPTLAMPSGATHFAVQLKYGSEGTTAITQAMVDSVTVNYQTT